MKNGKMLIVLSMLLIAPLATPLLINSAYALHTAQVYWVDASTPHLILESAPPMIPNNPNDTMALRNWTWDENPNNQVQLTFQVNDTAGQDITRAQFYIQEKGTSNAFFHFYNGSAPLSWETSILEKDTKGWARLIEFSAKLDPNTQQPINPIGPSGLAKWGNFSISFASTIEPVMQGIYYNFTVTTIDGNGYSAEHFIHLMFNTSPPTVTITGPAPNAHVLGALLPYCGNNYFTVSWNANSTVGLMNYTFLLNRTDDGKTWTKSEGNASMPLTTGNTLYTWSLNFATTSFNSTTIFFADPLDGNYTVDVWVWDGVGNMGHTSIQFDYMHPQKPFWLTPTSGFASPNTWYNSTTGVVQSTQVTQASTGKVLGTTVTVNGYSFAPTTLITVTVRIVTYDMFSGSNYEVPVLKTSTDVYGNFSASFVFPEAPKGTYNVTVWSNSSNQAYVTKCATAFTVSEKAIYQPLGDKPEQLIGPDIINVEATGFMAPNIVPDTNTIYALVNNKDALIGINQQTLFYWYFDGNGTLQDTLTFATGRVVLAGIVWPSMQPGTYNLTLFLATTGNWWNFDHWTAMTNDEYTNTITVQETLSLLISIKNDTAYIRNGTDIMNAKLDALNATITTMNGNVVTMNTNVGSMMATLDQLSPVITRIDGNVVTINTNVGTINSALNTLTPVITRIDGNVVTIDSALGPMSTTLNAINAKINSIDWTGLATMSTSFGQVNATVYHIDGNVASVKADTSAIKTSTDTIPAIKTNTDTIPNVPMTTYVIIILALLALIFAIVAAVESMRARVFIYKKTA